MSWRQSLAVKQKTVVYRYDTLIRIFSENRPPATAADSRPFSAAVLLPTMRCLSPSRPWSDAVFMLSRAGLRGLHGGGYFTRDAR